MRILFYFLICIYVLEGTIVIKDAGVAILTRGDVGMIFYVTLCNVGKYKYHITVKMDKCCETFTNNDMDCQLMHLVGGDMGYIYPNVTKNISLLYPNMYLHNRRGQCSILIKFKTDQNSTQPQEVKKSIKFDTFIYNEGIQPVLQGYYSKSELSTCDALDQDPLEKCEPVDCHIKYLGNKNYFNYKYYRCEKVPICVADPERELPDVSYFPTSNKCRDLETSISIEDLKHLEKVAAESCLNHEPAQLLLSANLRCHHGSLNNETGFCICKNGWMSAPVKKDQYEPGLFIYHMCNIEISTWNNIHNTKVRMTILIIAILGAAFAILLVMLSCICHLFYKCFFFGYRSPCRTITTPRSENEKCTTTTSTSSSMRCRKMCKTCGLFNCSRLNVRRKKPPTTCHSRTSESPCSVPLMKLTKEREQQISPAKKTLSTAAAKPPTPSNSNDSSDETEKEEFTGKLYPSRGSFEY